MNSIYLRYRLFEGHGEEWTSSTAASAAKRVLERINTATVRAPASGATLRLPTKSSDMDQSPVINILISNETPRSPPAQEDSHSQTQESAIETHQPSVPVSTVPAEPPSLTEMAEQELHSILQQLNQSLNTHNFSKAGPLLSRAKLALLHLNTLVPAPETSQQHLLLARVTLEMGALIAIRLKDPQAFTRYFQQLQPFYTLPENRLSAEKSNASKITGLYLLLLLSQGDYAGFHTLLESLEVAAAERGGKSLEEDHFIQYPVRLEQALMEGSYDRVWGETKGESVPSEEFGVFSEVLINTIRSEIASCSERAYTSLPISNAKNLFFLDSEGAVVEYARHRGWTIKDGRIWFPQREEDLMASEKDILATSNQVISNTLGYARELETIV